jgi:hypothetical protein
MHPYVRCALFALPLLVLAGCSGGNGTPPAPPPATNLALFDPASGTLPLPNILATATAADPLAGRAVNAPMNPAESLAYINLHEVGGSNAVAGVNAPIYLRFTAPLLPATVTGANIKVFQLTPDGNPQGTENNPLGFTEVTGQFSFKYPAGGTDLWLFPEFPLPPATRYLYVVTNRVLDAATQTPIGPTAPFQAVASATQPAGAYAYLAPIWSNVVDGPNITLSGYAKVMNDLIAASATTTITQRSSIAVMGRFITSAAGAIVTNPITGAALPVETALRAFAMGSTQQGGLGGVAWDNSIQVTGTIPGVNLGVYWQTWTGQPAVPASIGSVVLGTINSGFLGLDPVAVANNAATMDLTGLSPAPLSNPAGVVQPFRNAGQLTGFYYTRTTIPFVYVVPAAAPPTGGYPLIIWQHGIEQSKESVLLLAQGLTGQGFAALAIDLPMHGDLALPAQQIQPGDSAATIAGKEAAWGQAFMAVGTPLATRSNIQQAAFDLDRLDLTVAAGGFNGLGALAPATTGINYAGISLGSIVGAYYLAGNLDHPQNLAVAPAFDQAPMPMKGLLSVPGARLAYLIQASPAFGPTVDTGLAAAGIPAGSPAYNAFFQATQTVLDTVDPASMATPLAPGQPSRLARRILVQEATSTTFDADGNPTDGDLVITNPYTRYFGNALGGQAVLGTAAAAAVDPGFYQLGYGAEDLVPDPFMATLDGTAIVPKAEPAALSPSASGPVEGYFQFSQPGIEHAGLLDVAGHPANAALMQTQMLYFLGAGGDGASIVADPTTVPALVQF